MQVSVVSPQNSFSDSLVWLLESWQYAVQQSALLEVNAHQVDVCIVNLDAYSTALDEMINFIEAYYPRGQVLLVSSLAPKKQSYRIAAVLDTDNIDYLQLPFNDAALLQKLSACVVPQNQLSL